MVWWVDRYQSVVAPSYEQVGSAAYYCLLLVKQFTIFAVPTFLVTSGVFVAYAARGQKSALTRRFVFGRLGGLLVPYVLWSIVAFIVLGLAGETDTLLGYVQRLAVGGAVNPYWYVIVLCQLYLLAPLITQLARTRWKLLLGATAITELLLMVVEYIRLIGESTPAGGTEVVTVPYWLFLRWPFFFSLGVVIGLHQQEFQKWLKQHRTWLAAALPVVAILRFLEGQVVQSIRGVPYQTFNQISYPSVMVNVYALALILCWLAFDERRVLFTRALNWLGARTYGVYLGHYLVLWFVAKGSTHVLPALLGHQEFFLPLLVIAGVGLPLAAMVVVTKSPLRNAYRYVFG
jgi:surface polysaccharide O-acyltransferase-like enzyme